MHGGGRTAKKGYGACSWSRRDPIGVAGQPAAADEYDSYVLALGSKLRAGASLDEIVNYLAQIRRERMELYSHAVADLAAAKAVLKWYSGGYGAREGHEQDAKDA